MIVNIHVLALAKRYANRILAFRHGELVYDGPPDELTDEKVESIYHVDAKQLEEL